MQKIQISPKPDSLELYTAAGEPMTVNGQVQLTATFKGKSKLIDALVSEDLTNEILMSWYDCEDLGSVSITRSVSLQQPAAPQCHRGYQIGQDLCRCIQKSKGCVTSKKAYLTFLGDEVFCVLFSLGVPILFICVH